MFKFKHFSFATSACASFITGACGSFFITSAILSDNNYHFGVRDGYNKAREEVRDQGLKWNNIKPTQEDIALFLLDGHEIKLLGDAYIVKCSPVQRHTYMVVKEDAEELDLQIQNHIENSKVPRAEIVSTKNKVREAFHAADCVSMESSTKLEAAMKRFSGNQSDE
jgi:hypothetical protein